MDKPKERKRSHSFHPPYNSYHILCLLLTSLTSSLYTILYFSIPHTIHTTIHNIILYTILLIIVYLFISLSCIESSGMQKMNSNGKNDKTRHCMICDIDIDDTTKHCNACNKCVYMFDHHCVWLNVCIGSVHYSRFVRICVMYSVYSVYKTGIVAYYMYVYDMMYIYYVVCIVQMTIDVCICIMLIDLIRFHIYLYTVGMTTYAYIKKKRTEKIEKIIGIDNIDIHKHIDMKKMNHPSTILKQSNDNHDNDDNNDTKGGNGIKIDICDHPRTDIEMRVSNDNSGKHTINNNDKHEDVTIGNHDDDKQCDEKDNK